MNILGLLGGAAVVLLVGGGLLSCTIEDNRTPGPQAIRVPYAQGAARPVLVVVPDLWAVDGTAAAWQAVAHPQLQVVRPEGERCRLVRSVDRPVGPGLESYACGWAEGVTQDLNTVLILERKVAVVLREGADAQEALRRFGLPVVETVGARAYVLDAGADPLGALPASIRLAADPAVANANPLIRFPRVVRQTQR